MRATVCGPEGFVQPEWKQQSTVHGLMTSDHHPILHQTDRDKRQRITPWARGTREKVDRPTNDRERRRNIQQCYIAAVLSQDGQIFLEIHPRHNSTDPLASAARTRSGGLSARSCRTRRNWTILVPELNGPPIQEEIPFEPSQRFSRQEYQPPWTLERLASRGCAHHRHSGCLFSCMEWPAPLGRRRPYDQTSLAISNRIGPNLDRTRSHAAILPTGSQLFLV